MQFLTFCRFRPEIAQGPYIMYTVRTKNNNYKSLLTSTDPSQLPLNLTPRIC